MIKGQRIARTLLSGTLLLGGVLTATVLIGGAQPASAAPIVTFYIVPSGTGDCTSPVNACGSVQTALAAAVAGSYAGYDVTVDVAAGSYTESDTVDASTLSSLTLQGAGAATTTLSGNGGTILVVTAGTVSVSDVTFANGGNGGGNGGALDICDGSSGCTAHVTNSTFSNDSANVGGAIDNADNHGQSLLTVSGSTFTGDSAADGPGAGAHSTARGRSPR